MTASPTPDPSPPPSLGGSPNPPDPPSFTSLLVSSLRTLVFGLLLVAVAFSIWHLVEAWF
jgi:hypothetical protein